MKWFVHLSQVLYLILNTYCMIDNNVFYSIISTSTHTCLYLCKHLQICGKLLRHDQGYCNLTTNLVSGNGRNYDCVQVSGSIPDLASSN